jgi:predicted phage terminase large subunit-like protein
MKASDAASASVRKSVIDWYCESLPSRLDIQAKGAIILAIQRLHEEDLAGFLLEQAEWPYLNLPANAQDDQVVSIGPNQTYHWQAGEILHPGLWTGDDLDRLKREHGSQAFSAIYLQRPAPADGNMIKRKWLKTYDGELTYEEGDRIVQSWDTALKAGAHDDYSVCTTWLVKGDRFYLYDVVREKLEHHALYTHSIELANAQGADHVLIEDKGSGTSLFQDLQEARTGVYPIPIEPEGDKVTRIATVTPLLENGQVFLPKEAPWLADFVNELMAFPHSKHDDQVDSF